MSQEAFPEEPGESLALSDLELVHLGRMLHREQIFRVFLVSGILVAAGLGAYFSWAGSWSGTRVVILLLILLGARAHLRHLRSARLLRKLAAELGILPSPECS